MSIADILLWGVLPYVTLVILIGGTIWRYKYDQFGWTTRSSQLYESRLMRVASPLFHLGILVVLVGHIVGLVIPKSWTDAMGVSEHLYHLMAMGFGSLAGFATLIGLLLLIWRRRRVTSVFMATTGNDKVMYAVLLGTIVLGISATLIALSRGAEAPNYRLTISPWFRSVFLLRPDVEAMAAAPLSFHLHVLLGMGLFILWPFTRLVHAFTAPVHYLFRPYIVYRSRDARGRRSTSPIAARWDPVNSADTTSPRPTYGDAGASAVRRGRRRAERT
ncbi:respiratory nitrate reductase subunit gamma [Rothia kristinae]|uniref:Nitrate reductase-like protein NarX n=1 Tax=Rothia kristinae TaxID=37923 RepID=A0A1S2MZG2_9MICC|nr:respiratory nitrate reductase subunit gamma [Rothia kristinae]OIJ35390.1 respiratory nitrate reductase subunit gamma [Rothia kristinae]